MQDDKSFISNIISRRIPQIIGMYIAAVWLAVEMADWMSGKFSVLPQLSSYVFIGMLTFLPAVVLLAWGHGRPGKDHWSTLEKFWIPINILVSIFVISVVVKSPSKITLPKVQEQTIAPLKLSSGELLNKKQVLKEGLIHANYNRVLLLFWENKTNNKDNDWLSYASSWLVSQDLTRTPNISSVTPYYSKTMLQRIQNKGFLDAKNIPFALALQLAKKSSKKWLVTGAFLKEGDAFNFETTLYKVETGELVLTIKEQNKNMFVALDKISTKISQFLVNSDTTKDNVIPDLAIQEHVSDNLEAIRSLINAYNLASFKNDYDGAIDSINKALELDKNFALAHILAVSYYQKLGDYHNAIKHADKALALDYKIYQEQIFDLKANKFYMQGDRDKAGLVQEKWVSLFPNSPRAHGALAGYYLYSNNKLDLAKQELEVLLKIDKDNPSILINLGRIYRIQENKAKAVEVLGQYLKENPDEADAYMQMGYALSQFGFYKKAIKLYEQASILGTDDFDAEIAKAMDTMQLGLFDDALNQLDDLLKHSSTDQEKYWVLDAKLEIFSTLGQVNQALKTLEQMRKPGKNVMDPFDYMFNLENRKINLLIEQGKFKQAIKYCDSLRKKSKPPFSQIVSIFYLIAYGEMEDEASFTKEFKEFKAFLNNYNSPYWKSFLPALESRIVLWNGDYQKALSMLDDSVKVIKQSISGLGSYEIINKITFFKAKILRDMKNYDGALEVLDAIAQRDPTFAKAYAASAEIYKTLNQMDKFQLYYDKAMKIWHNADDDFVELNKLKSLKT